MRFRKIVFLMVFSLFLLLGGCKNESPDIKETRQFMKVESQSYLLSTEYKVCNADHPIIVYFPVITNKQITKTELGGVASYSFIENGDVKIRLKSETQDRLNIQYAGYYISFLKYQVVIDNYLCLQPNDKIELCDTKIWLYNNEEYDTVNFDAVYLRISIVENRNDMYMPNWETITNNMLEKIKMDLEL